MTTSKQTAPRPAAAVRPAQAKKRLAHPETQEYALLKFEDDFADYADISAFLCNAFAATIKEPQWLTPEIVSGARLCSCWLQRRASELRAELNAATRQFNQNNEKGR